MSVTNSSSRRDFLHEVVATLFPAPWGQTTSVRPWQGRSRGQRAGTRRYALVPSAANPAVAVPLSPRRGAASVIANYKASARGFDRFGLRSLAALARTGALQLWPAQLVLAAPADGDHGSLESHLSDVLGRPIQLSVYTSPPRANRKPVVQLLDDHGCTFGYAKIGVNPLTSRLVRGEAQALRTLAGQSLPGLRTPTTLYDGVWAGLPIVVQAPLDVRTSLSVPQDVLVHAMTTVAQIAPTQVVPATANGYLSGLRARLADVGTRRGQWLGEALTAWCRATAPGEAIRLAAWHGDWTPWNMAYDRAALAVWDWERFETGVPAGYDALHFASQAAIVGAGRAPGQAVESMLASAAELLAPFGVRPDDAERIGLLYLLELAARYEADGQEAAGARLGVLEDWLMPALAGRLGLVLPEGRR
jgi:hypothetical protein